MPENEDKIKKLYDTFVSDGYDMESEEDFRKNLSDSTKRKAAYDALVKEGYEMEPFEEFENNIGFGKIQTPVPEPAVQTEQAWQPTEQEKAEMIASTNRMMQNVETQIQDANERVDNIQEYGLNPGLQTKEGKMQFNPENGKLEKTYITPLGNKTTSKPLADIESFRYRQAADMSIGGQLRKANLRLQELKAKQAERASEVHKEWVEETEKNKAPLAAILGAATYTPRQQSDKENSALRVAIRETEELIKNLEEQKDRENGVDVGFWRGFGRTMGDVRTWDFGMGDMADAMTMMNADKLKGDNATEGERESHDMMMGAIHEKQQAEERYGGNADFWNRAGIMTGYMPSFMLDFILTGGGFNGLSTFSKGSTKVAAKVIGKETAEKMAQQGFKSYIKENGVRGLGQYVTDWTIKALGTTADDLLVRAPLMTNTIQAGKTVSDIIDRKLGDVVVDENGNYDFSNDKTWGSAIWQGEANAIIENYSEMFGAHLDPILTLGNMSKLANVLGAKRLGGVLSKADAGALNSIMGQTHQMFNKMGVSDYVGEVSEEYYGQLWRTMLNLDDAYQQNPDGTHTNLFATGQFHGDIWGGMALSMGLMGAGKHTLSAANYASMKHGVNKADAKVNELLGKEVWEPLKATLDLTTNENIGEVAELVVGDKDFTADEKAAVLNYMERSLNLRGFNLASMARSRGGVQSESEQQANDSYLDGYNVTSSQEMNDAKNLYEYHRTQVADLADESMFAMIEENPIAALEFVNGNEQWSDEDKSSVIDYINAKQVYNGMIQRVRDDIDGRVEQSNSMIDARVNRKTGMIQGATMKQDERKVYVLSGTLVPYADGSGVSVTDSDNSIIVRDADTGGLEQVSPDAILSIDDVQDPYEQKELAAQSIREQFARETADRIDGVVTFNPGETYTIAGEGGSQIQVTIVSDENGIIDNGDGTINVTDGTNVFPIAKEAIQQFVDASNIARIAEFEQQRAEENFALQQEEQEADRPQYAMNDLVTLRDENGIGIRGNITADVDADGLYEVYTEDALNGKRVNMFTREELDSMLIEHNGQPVEIANSSVNDNSEVAASSLEEQQLQVSALERIPKDEQGNPIYEQAETPDLAWDAIVEQTEGDEAMAQSVANGMVVDKEAALKKIEKTKSAGGNTIAEKIVAEKERKAAIDAAKQELSIWQKIAGTANRRKMEADAERRRIADEATALRKAEEEKLRAEREEAERKEREALNGVPDIVEDVPKDARARGYRRVNGHKVDRQGPLQAVQGKEVNVKFSNDVVVPGNVTVIDASLLQPSHIQGVRNPLHFIDEAQPKERNDEASVLSARKIAENIRPEEITSSITAYTGAPTVNERGEVIQGNNRSDALRLMWESHSEQAEAYRQYLKDHAEEFGLRAEDIAPIQSPVLVNMLHVDDTEALNLGQFVAQDTESGGVERIKPKNTLQRMGTEMRSFANLLLRTSDDEMSFAGLVDANGANVLKWMSQRGFISHTQYKSAFDSKGNLTPESKNDLRGIMYQSIFKDGSTRLEEMFNVLPVKAQKAILATAFRDYDSPNSERMVDEIQNSVRAYYALSQDKMFAEAKNFKEARIAVENWKRQYQMDDVTGESYLPADNFSNFVLHLAAMYKGESQSFIQNTFGKIYDLIQGTQEETLFEQPDNTPRTLVQAIKEALNLDYNGQQRSNVLVGDTATSQRGQQGSNGALAPRERVEDGNGTTDDTGRTESIGEQSEIEPSLSEEDDELKREDDGAYTDDEVSYDNDSVAKLLGQSRRTAKQRRKFAQRERQRMAERVVSLTEKLHLDNVEVVTDASTLDGKKQRAKGFYSKSTGKITIVIPNHTSMFDVEQTLLHEAVAHYGLRQLFGEHFDTFLDNVFNNADEIIRRRIVDMASKNGWDFRKATEEYLAGLAEHINFEEARKNGWWQRIKQFFFEMLDKLGFSDFRGVTLTDNELRYILWRSYENLKEGKHSNLFGEAADIAMQHKLMVGEFADTSTDDVLNRDGDPEIHERTLARAKYEQRVKSGMYQSQEALQDSMLGLKEAMNAILGKNTRMEDVDGFENAYLGENRLSSVNKAEADAFAHLLFKPMLEEVAKLAHNTAEREELTDYMMAKHGLERNRVMAERDAQKDFAEYQKQHSKSTKTLQNFIDECRKRDYAGLTALTGMEEIADAEAEAQVMVDEYENAHDTTALWSKVNAVSKAVLSKSYECGMMSKETYDSVRDMYEFYIPLRGFDEKTSSEAYAYLTHRQSAFNAPIKKAEGRKSKADDPFAYLQSMAEGTIMQGNRNKLVKQKFLNFALNHPSDLVSVSDLWLQYDAVSDEWKPIFPDNIDINDSPEEVERKLNEFEDKMKQLAESAPDNYKHGKDAANIPYRVVESRDLRQHQVVVKRNGRDYVITINGNPRAAQALNGQTNPDNDISGSIGQLVHLIGDVNRTLSSLYTTLQPDFIASNFLRDMVYSNSMVWVKESPKYAIQYNMNFAKLPIVRMVMLLDKYRRGTLDMNDEIEKMFYQFMMNGGETGFSRMADIDEHKKEIKKMLKAANEKIPAHVVRECMATWIGEVGRGIEMRARFAAFVTSRNAGRTIDRSIWDAKEISVNFNKKGAGDKFLGAEGQTMLGNVAAGVSGAGRAGYIFWNAALQGTFGNFLKYAMRHPGKMGTVVASWYGLAMLVTALASAGGDDDDDSYYDIPEHTRRQNLIVKGPGNAWIKIPLPIEYRAVYAMGELTGSSLFHNEKLEVSDVLAQMSQLLPVDMMEGTKALWPSSVKPMVEVSNNESWYGSPIWKDTPYNKYMPNWTKAYKSANKDLVNLSETLNEVSGGSKYRKGTIDLNPAAIEYLLKQYTGGFFTVTNQIRNLINVGTGEKDFDWRYVPLANRMLMSGGDERNVGRGLDEKFFGYLDAYRAKASEFSAIKGDLSLPLEKKAELISEIIIDPEYVKMKGMERIYSKLKKAYDTAKEIGDTSKAEELEKRINELKRTFILEMEQDERK